MLKSRSWKGVYRSDADNLLEDFYFPALMESVSYDRAVGFFSAAMLSYAAQGISALIENGGSMRLIFGGEIDAAEAEAIASGYEQKHLAEKLGKAILSQIDSLSDALANQRLAALSWLVANGHLDIKLALKRRGMYHEKIGIFGDAAGDSLIFQGSANETVYALLPDFNFESINVFPSWRPELTDHFQPYLDGFERLWRNQTKDTLVIDFPEAAKERLIKISIQSKRPPSVSVELDIWRKLTQPPPDEPTQASSLPTIPVSFRGAAFEVMSHQRAALNAWKSHDLQGILAMATGSGKTVTSIYGMVKLFEQTKRQFLIVAVPYQTLADQWVDELAIFNIFAIRCYESSAIWADRLSYSISAFEIGALNFCCCVVVNRTLESPAFQERLKRIPSSALAFIGDECHHHAAPGLNAALPTNARYRLGLSATPKHYFDDQRTDSLIKYYGPVVYEYGLSEALRDGVLTPYKYFVHFVDLSDAESEEYLDLTVKISKLAAGAKVDDLVDPADGQLKMLLFRRARLLGNAENKIVVLKELLEGLPVSAFHLFYCGDGSVENDDDELVRQVDLVSKALFDRGWNVSHFTSRESRDARRQILDNFKIGVIDGLVAIRCLDEGVDVPDCRVAYILASSRNPKQFIQRRGRILRRAANKESAVVHDFVVRLPDDGGGADSPSRRLLIAELGRVAEFGGLAMNRSDVYQTLKPTLIQYDLEHFFA
jgi:superfamily II DNA or RNA helicase